MGNSNTKCTETLNKQSEELEKIKKIIKNIKYEINNNKSNINNNKSNLSENLDKFKLELKSEISDKKLEIIDKSPVLQYFHYIDEIDKKINFEIKDFISLFDNYHNLQDIRLLGYSNNQEYLYTDLNKLLHYYLQKEYNFDSKEINEKEIEKISNILKHKVRIIHKNVKINGLEFFKIISKLVFLFYQEKLMVFDNKKRKQNRRLIVFDFDQTITKIHVYAKYRKLYRKKLESNDDFYKFVKDDLSKNFLDQGWIDQNKKYFIDYFFPEDDKFSYLIKELIKNNDIAIASFGNKKVIKYMIERYFDNKNIKNIFSDKNIITPEDLGYSPQTFPKDKNTMLDELMKRFEITDKKKVFLIDDSEPNIEKAKGKYGGVYLIKDKKGIKEKEKLEIFSLINIRLVNRLKSVFNEDKKKEILKNFYRKIEEYKSLLTTLKNDTFISNIKRDYIIQQIKNINNLINNWNIYPYISKNLLTKMFDNGKLSNYLYLLEVKDNKYIEDLGDLIKIT